MSEENNHNSKKEKNQLSPSQLLEKYKFFYLVHGKSISEFSPDLNILLRKFLIKKIYDLSHSSPEIKQRRIFKFNLWIRKIKTNIIKFQCR